MNAAGTNTLTLQLTYANIAATLVVPVYHQGTWSSLGTQQKYLGPPVGTEWGQISPPHTFLHWPHWGAEPCPDWGAQVFFSGWWWPSCQSCSSNLSYSCSIACERGEISKQLRHHFLFLEMDRRPGRCRFGFGLVWDLFLFGWCRFWFCCFLEDLVLFSLSLLSLRCQECKLIFSGIAEGQVGGVNESMNVNV